VQIDPRSYSKGVSQFFTAADSHDHTMTHKHPSFYADHVLSPETRTWLTDPMWLIQDLLLDTGLLGAFHNLHFHATQPVNQNGERLFNEAWTGMW
jgi:hypothetical protein